MNPFSLDNSDFKPNVFIILLLTTDNYANGVNFYQNILAASFF